MDKKELYIYKDKIKKLHKAAISMKRQHDGFNEYHKTRLFGPKFNSDTDWVILDKFLKDNPELQTMLDEVEDIIKYISK